MIDGFGTWSGKIGKANRRIDCLIERRATICQAHNPHRDKIGPLGGQRLMSQEAVNREVCHKLASRRNQRLKQLATLECTQI